MIKWNIGRVIYLKSLRNIMHHILSEYGWQKIHKSWITKLNQLSKVKEKNFLYGVLDCDSDGDCFFHCIANALNERDRETDNYYDANDIREIISDNITEEQYDTIITYYRIVKDADDFSEGWDPYSIHSIEEFKEKIKTSGHEYWGTPLKQIQPQDVPAERWRQPLLHLLHLLRLLHLQELNRRNEGSHRERQLVGFLY